MNYKLKVSPHTERQIENALLYVSNTLSNPSAAAFILADIEDAYDILESAPESFPLCDDPYLKLQNYRKFTLRHHSYLFIYRIQDSTVYLAGFFHMLENYAEKL